MDLSCYDSLGTDFDVSRELLEKERQRYTAQGGVSYWDIKIHKFKTFLEVEVPK